MPARPPACCRAICHSRSCGPVACPYKAYFSCQVNCLGAPGGPGVWEGTLDLCDPACPVCSSGWPPGCTSAGRLMCINPLCAVASVSTACCNKGPPQDYPFANGTTSCKPKDWPDCGSGVLPIQNGNEFCDLTGNECSGPGPCEATAWYQCDFMCNPGYQVCFILDSFLPLQPRCRCQKPAPPSQPAVLNPLSVLPS